jgi:tripartite-type tricarboxylate transporter receptor subunit TctC
MLTRRISTRIISIAATLLAMHAPFAGAAAANSGQDFPNRPIRVVTSTPGGGNDIASRILAQGIAGPLGQAVIVENRPSILSKEIAAKAQPDGHTLYVVGSQMWSGPLAQNPDKPYDPMSEFAPISLVATRPFILVAHANVAVNSVKELIAAAKAKPGALTFARASLGADDHLAVELLKSMTGINVLIVPYSGSGPALIGIIGGQVDLYFNSGLGNIQPHLKSGRLKMLAVSGAQPSALTPGVPTVAATVPGFDVSGVTGVYAPIKTPAAVINRLNREIVRYVKSPDGIEKFSAKGDDVVGSSPQEHAAKIAKISKLLKDTGIRPE